MKEIIEKIGTIGTILDKHAYSVMRVTYYPQSSFKEIKYYLCKDEDRFKKMSFSERSKQEIERLISRTIFLFNTTIQYFKYDETAETIKILSEHFKEDIDPLLLSAIQLGEGANFSNQHILLPVKKVIIYKKVSDKMSGGLFAGLGYPGETYSVFIAERNRFFANESERIFIIEKVESYTDGYKVYRTEITEDVFYFCRLFEYNPFTITDFDLISTENPFTLKK